MLSELAPSPCGWLLQFQRAVPSTALDKGIYFIEGEYSGLTAVVKNLLTMFLCYCILLLSIFINHSSAKAGRKKLR
jgi:hypothetical protein